MVRTLLVGFVETRLFAVLFKGRLLPLSHSPSEANRRAAKEVEKDRSFDELDGLDES